MGGMNSCCIPNRSCDCGMSNVTSTPKPKSYRKNLSATFNLSLIEDTTKNNSLVNINTATEEELMTLPGVNRSIAQNIIDYRNHIGGFRCIEDLALASGVGAEKLEVVRHDVYVVPPAVLDTNKNMQSGSIRRNSVPPSSLTNINTANIFSLIRVKGIGMSIAKGIVAYRDKHGKFKSLDELLRVKGIGPSVLNILRPQLSLEDSQVPTENANSNENHNFANGKIGKDSKSIEDAENHYVRRSVSSLENLLEILGPLAKIPERPKVKQVPLKHNNKKVFRLATWNLERFSVEKARNPGVKDVICMTILENGFSIISCQELADKDSLQEICDELNSPTLPNVKKWRGKKGQWAVQVSEAAGRMFQGMEYNGFLYDKSQNIDLIKSSLLEKAPGWKKPFVRMPFLGIFKVDNAFDCILVSLHLKAQGLSNEDKEQTAKEIDLMDDVVAAIQYEVKGEEDIIILGDFNMGPDERAFDCLRSQGYKHCIPADIFTNISYSNPNGSRNYDNVWLSTKTQSVSTGVSGVVREGLSSHWIPHDWSWGGVVSDHCPVYVQLYATMDLDSGDVHDQNTKFVLYHDDE